MQWAYCRIQEAKEDTVRLNPVGARSLEGLGALVRLGFEGFLLFVSCIPTLFFSGSFYHLEGSYEVFRRILWFSLQ